MKIKKEVELTSCDICGSTQCFNRCLECGVDHCFDCRKEHGVEYKHAVYSSGTGDGYYCLACDEQLTHDGNDSLHNAYLEIYSLRQEVEQNYLSFKDRSDKAESMLKKLLG